MKKFVGILVGSLFFATSAHADLLGEQERTRVATPDRQYLSALAGFSMVDDDRGGEDALNSGDGLHAVGIYGHQWDNNWGLETSFAAEAVRSGGHRVTAILDGYYGFGNRRAGDVVPYYLAGIGLALNDIDSEQDIDMILNLGLGIAAPLDNLLGLRVRFRGEVRYLNDQFADGSDDFRISLGLEVPLFR